MLFCSEYVLFCSEHALFCSEYVLFCSEHVLFCSEHVLFCSERELFCSERVLFCSENELFCSEHLLFCSEHVLFCSEYVLFCSEHVHFSEHVSNYFLVLNRMNRIHNLALYSGNRHFNIILSSAYILPNSSFLSTGFPTKISSKFHILFLLSTYTVHLILLSTIEDYIYAAPHYVTLFAFVQHV